MVKGLKEADIMYEPVRNFIERRGYKGFIDGNFETSRNVLKFKIHFPGSDKFYTPDVVGFKLIGDEVRTVAIECKMGRAETGLGQAIYYLPFFHEVIIVAPKGRQAIEEINRRFNLGIGYAEFNLSKKRVVENTVLEAQNRFFDINQFSDYVKPYALTSLSLRYIEEKLEKEVEVSKIQGSQQVFFKDGTAILKIKYEGVSKELHFEVRWKRGNNYVHVGLHLEMDENTNNEIFKRLSNWREVEKIGAKKSGKNKWLWLEKRIENVNLERPHERLGEVSKTLAYFINTLGEDLKLAYTDATNKRFSDRI